MKLARSVVTTLAMLSLLVATSGATAQSAPPPRASQNPSPMTELTRAHERLTRKSIAGTRRSFVGPGGKPVEVMIPVATRRRDEFNLVIHFHGEAWLPEQSVAELGDATVAAVVNLGAGSGAYDRAFSNPPSFDSLLSNISREVAQSRGRALRLNEVTLSGFSAGHGAIRAILRDEHHFAKVGAVLLLDGMHTSYVPEATVLALGGTLDTTNLVAIRNFARAAIRGEKRMLITHSEIFPGTFASTTETADWLLDQLGLRRTAVMKWGPRGMQQLSEAKQGRFELRGFAGNSAPDHIDQLHAMPELLSKLKKD